MSHRPEDDDEERRPLLSSTATTQQQQQRQQQQPPLLGGKQQSTDPTLWTRAKRRWPVFRLLIFSFLAYSAKGFIAISIFDTLRAFACADHYAAHPNDVAAAATSGGSGSGGGGGGGGRSPHELCSIPQVEANVASLNLAANVAASLLSMLSLTWYGPALSRFGRKPVTFVALVNFILTGLPFIVLPLGYPYGRPVDEMPISPRTCIVLIIVVSSIKGLLGDDGMFELCSRVLMVDQANDDDRSLLLTWHATAQMVSLLVGPIVGGLILDRFQTGRVFESTYFRQWLTRSSQHHTFPGPSPDGSNGGGGGELPIIVPPRPAPIPIDPESLAYTNTSTYYAATLLLVLAGLWLAFVVPESLHNDKQSQQTREGPAAEGQERRVASADGDEDDEGSANRRINRNGSSASQRRKSVVSLRSLHIPATDAEGRPKGHYDRHHHALTRLLGPLAIFLPHKSAAEPAGGLNWMIALLGTVQFLYGLCSGSIDVLLMYAGYRFGWAAKELGRLISYFGATRAFALVVFVPALRKVLEKVVARPPAIRSASEEELNRLANQTLSDEDDRAEADDAAQQQREQQRAFRLWRTSIDLSLSVFSTAADIVAFIVIIASGFGAGQGHPALAILGIALLSMGSGGNPALASASIAIVEDIYSQRSEAENGGGSRPEEAEAEAEAEAAGESAPLLVDGARGVEADESEQEEEEEEQQMGKPSDAFLAATSIIDALCFLVSPLLYGLLYSLTTVSGVVSLTFVLPALTYALLCSMLIAIKRRLW